MTSNNQDYFLIKVKRISIIYAIIWNLPLTSVDLYTPQWQNKTPL